MGVDGLTPVTDLVRGSCGKPTSLQKIFYTGKLSKIYVDASFLFHRTRLKRAASLAVLRAKYAPTNANVASAIMLALFDLKASVGDLFRHLSPPPAEFAGIVPVLVLAFEQASNTCVICISCCLLCSPLFLFFCFFPPHRSVLKAETAEARVRNAHVDHVLESARAMVEAQPDKVLNLAFSNKQLSAAAYVVFFVFFEILDFSSVHQPFACSTKNDMPWGANCEQRAA
jgi:hypothetical protein